MNKKSPTAKKLVLHRETVRRLTNAELAGVAGGRWNQTTVTQCECPTFTQDDPLPMTRVNTACTVTIDGCASDLCL